MKRGLVVGISVALFCLAPASSFAQDLDDTLDAELDALSKSAPSPPTTAVKPSPSTDVSLDEPLSDPFAEDEKTQAATPKSDLQPLETSAAPPQKKAMGEKAKTASVRKSPTNKPLRTEPVVVPENIPTANSASSLAPGSDEPNSNFESRLASIYAEHSDPVSEEKWTGLLGSRAAESYSVQAGDTLWDLSQTLFADGFYWSKLWAENPEIQNPHQIAKGQAIRFIGGTEASPPEVRVVKDEPDQLTIQTQAAFEKEDFVPALQEPKPDEIGSVEIKASTKFSGTPPNRALNSAPYYQEDIEGKITQADLEAGVVVEQSEIVPRPILPPPSEERKKVLLNIPRSFAEYKSTRLQRTVTVQRRSRMAEKIPAAIVPPFLAFEKLPEALGEVSEVDQAEVASLGQSVYVRGNEELKIGANYFSVMPRYDVRSSKNGRIGSAVEVGGMLRIAELVDEKEKIYRATVIYGVNPVRRGSMVLAGEPPRIKVTTTGRRFTSEMMIVGGSFAEKRYFFGDGATVFLDTFGTDVRIGDVLAVQARRGERRTTIIPDQSTSIGMLKVFAVSGQVASAVVILTTDDIHVGDKTGAVFPRALPDLINKTPRLTRASN